MGGETTSLTADRIYDVDYQFAARSKILFNPLEGTRLTFIADYSGTKEYSGVRGRHTGLINGNLGAASGPRPDLGYNANFNGPRFARRLCAQGSA